jgi:SPP1 gp7 family putative phage head morphogenesis protein
MWNVSSNPQKFESAIAWFRARVPMTRDEWQKLTLRNRRKAFTIGGVAQMDIVNDVYSEIANALEKGEHLEDFQKRITEKLMTVWDSKKKASARAQTIIRNAHQSAYSAGRFEQMTKPAVTKARPYWMFDGVLDRRQGEICRERNDIIRRFDDPWWRMNYPPLHHRCRSGVRTLTARQALERGIKELPKLPKPTRGFGLIPTENEWQPDPKDYQPALFKVWTKKLEKFEER